METTNINTEKESEHNTIEQDKHIQTKNTKKIVNNKKPNKSNNDKITPKVKNVNETMINESISFAKINTEYEKNLFLHKPSDYPIYILLIIIYS